MSERTWRREREREKRNDEKLFIKTSSDFNWGKVTIETQLLDTITGNFSTNLHHFCQQSDKNLKLKTAHLNRNNCYLCWKLKVISRVRPHFYQNYFHDFYKDALPYNHNHIIPKPLISKHHISRFLKIYYFQWKLKDLYITWRKILIFIHLCNTHGSKMQMQLNSFRASVDTYDISSRF